MRAIKDILMERDGLTEAEAQSQIDEAREALDRYIANGELCYAEDICSEYFGLEPDYIDELL
jgi:hypothetical protein